MNLQMSDGTVRSASPMTMGDMQKFSKLSDEKRPNRRLSRDWRYLQ